MGRRISLNRRTLLESLIGYDARQNHAEMTLAELGRCDCGQPSTHIEYVVIGWECPHPEPLPLCDACHMLHVEQEARPMDGWIVPTRSQVRHGGGVLM